jgi:hypothetical protein
VPVYKTQRSVEFKVNEFPNVLYLDIDGELIEALHTNERVLTDEDIANLLGIKGQTAIDRVSKTIGKISKHPEIQKIDPSR